MQTLKYNRCKFAFISIFVFNNTRFSNFIHSEPMLSKNLWSSWMRQKNHYKKSVHITLLALLLIQVFVFIILYYSDMFTISSSGKYNVEDTEGEGRSQGGVVGLRLSGKQRDLAIYTHIHPLCNLGCIHVCCIYELACAYSTQAFAFVFLKEWFANSTLFGATAPRPSSDPWLRSIHLLELQLPLSLCDFQKGRASDFQH